MSRNRSESSINRKLISVKSYLDNKNKKWEMLFRIIDGEGFYVLKGEMFSVDEIEKLFPTNSLLCFSENCDPRYRSLI